MHYRRRSCRGGKKSRRRLGSCRIFFTRNPRAHRALPYRCRCKNKRLRNRQASSEGRGDKLARAHLQPAPFINFTLQGAGRRRRRRWDPESLDGLLKLQTSTAYFHFYLPFFGSCSSSSSARFFARARPTFLSARRSISSCSAGSYKYVILRFKQGPPKPDDFLIAPCVSL